MDLKLMNEYILIYWINTYIYIYTIYMYMFIKFCVTLWLIHLYVYKFDPSSVYEYCLDMRIKTKRREGHFRISWEFINCLINRLICFFFLLFSLFFPHKNRGWEQFGGSSNPLVSMLFFLQEKKLKKNIRDRKINPF